MARTSAYLRVSTPEQTTENQVQKFTASGFQVEPHRIVTETVSGSVAISQRPEFARLADRLEAGDVLVVTKFDRRGRNTMNVTATVVGLNAAGIKVHCLALGGVDRNRLSGEERQSVLELLATGASISSLARKFNTSRQTIMRVRDGVPAGQS